MAGPWTNGCIPASSIKTQVGLFSYALWLDSRVVHSLCQEESFGGTRSVLHRRRSAPADAEYAKLHIMWLVARLASKYLRDRAEPQCLSGDCREPYGKARHTDSRIRSPSTCAGSGKPVSYRQPADGSFRICRLRIGSKEENTDGGANRLLSRWMCVLPP